MKYRRLWVLLLAAVPLAGCEPQARGFALPPGDVAQGLETFRTLQCNQCHSIAGVIDHRSDSLYPEVNVRLGGPVLRVKSYGELVTAIIHPTKAVSRPVGEAAMIDDRVSVMPIYNDRMTVTQLVNLATFLQETYELTPPPYRAGAMP